MGGRSVFANVMLVFIAAILLVGFYLTVGAVDIFRQREEKLVSEVSGLRSEVTQLRETIERGGFSSLGPVGSGPTPQKQFANEDLRDPNAVEEGADWKDDLNPNSLETLTACLVEPSLRDATPGSRYQFERMGYFCVDPDSSPERLVFNRTVTLKDPWARMQKRNGG